jgi:hypothetical protein
MVFPKYGTYPGVFLPKVAPGKIKIPQDSITKYRMVFSFKYL